VRFAAIGAGGAILFKGRFLLSGIYRYAYGAEDAESRKADGFRLCFVPDRAMATLLPHWEEQRTASALEVENADVFVQAVIRTSVLRSLYDGRIPSVSGHVSVWIDGYVVSPNHDVPVYSVRFVSVPSPEMPARKPELVEELGD
jgi:hypothetical protein